MTVHALDNLIKGILTRAGVDNPDGDSREILAAVLEVGPSGLFALRDTDADDDVREKAVHMAQRRASGEPIQYVIGSWSFMGREYRVGKGVLIPRDDTEVVTQAALRLISSVEKPVIADLCSGSGIIAVTLERELTDPVVYAVEKSETAYAYLRENARLNDSDVKTVLSDLKDCVTDFEDGSLDLLVSNPPYIRSDEIAGLQSEVQYEPRLALDGGESGYDFYDMIITLWSRKLKSGGVIALEIGEGQFDHISDLLKRSGYTDIKGYKDIQDITRAITAIYTPGF